MTKIEAIAQAIQCADPGDGEAVRDAAEGVVYNTSITASRAAVAAIMVAVTDDEAKAGAALRRNLFNDGIAIAKVRGDGVIEVIGPREFYITAED